MCLAFVLNGAGHPALAARHMPSISCTAVFGGSMPIDYAVRAADQWTAQTGYASPHLMGYLLICHATELLSMSCWAAGLRIHALLNALRTAGCPEVHRQTSMYSGNEQHIRWPRIYGVRGHGMRSDMDSVVKMLDYTAAPLTRVRPSLCHIGHSLHMSRIVEFCFLPVTLQ